MQRRKMALILLFCWLFSMISGCRAEQPAADVFAPSSSAPPHSASASSSGTVPTVPPPRKMVVCIDAGHQQSPIWEREPIGPGATETKAMLSSGTQGVSTDIPEYQLNLEVALLLEQELIRRGYEVVMIRRTNDCPLSNAQRAKIANESGADLFIRIHANGAEDPSVSGMLCCAPSRDNPYLSRQVLEDSIRLSQTIVEHFCAATGANDQGIYYVDNMTGINWCQIPVTIVEMGYMSNPAEDEAMATHQYRAKMVEGISNGIDAFLKE